MRVFVAGATGALGVPLVRQLVAAGHHVVGLTRSTLRGAAMEMLGAHAAIANALDAAELAKAVAQAKPEVVANVLTSLPRGGPRRARDLEPTNELRTRGTSNLMAAAVAAGVRRVVAESIVFAYGWRVDDVASIDESHPRAIQVEPALQPTLDATVSLEDQTLGVASIEGIVLRYGLLYGAGSGSMEALVDGLRARRLPVFGSEGSLLPWIHVDDGARAMARAIEVGAPGESYNIVDDAPVSLRDYMIEAARAAGAPRPRSVPFWLVRLLMPYASAMGDARLPVSNAKAKRDLGWRPTYPTCRDGLRHDLGTELRQSAAAAPP
jgi:nucleoside-diphosphate-sugar epimerase